jgi:allantoin racemase
MKILLVNPNITIAVTDLMAVEARRVAAPATQIVAATAAFGTLYIENRAEAAIAGHAVLDALAEHSGDCDAAIVAAFGDPGLAGAKEFMDPGGWDCRSSDVDGVDVGSAFFYRLHDGALTHVVWRMRG